MSERAPDSTDLHVSRRLRERRNAIGMTQETLAGALGVSFQQIQKYERGVNRISAGRLAQIAGALGVTVEHFFAEAGQ